MLLIYLYFLVPDYLTCIGNISVQLFYLSEINMMVLKVAVASVGVIVLCAVLEASANSAARANANSDSDGQVSTVLVEGKFSTSRKKHKTLQHQELLTIFKLAGVCLF